VFWQNKAVSSVQLALVKLVITWQQAGETVVGQVSAVKQFVSTAIDKSKQN
jgi:hypothetical protein